MKAWSCKAAAPETSGATLAVGAAQAEPAAGVSEVEDLRRCLFGSAVDYAYDTDNPTQVVVDAAFGGCRWWQREAADALAKRPDAPPASGPKHYAFLEKLLTPEVLNKVLRSRSNKALPPASQERGRALLKLTDAEWDAAITDALTKAFPKENGPAPLPTP